MRTKKTIDAETAETAEIDRPKGIPTARTARKQNNARRHADGVRTEHKQQDKKDGSKKSARLFRFFRSSSLCVGALFNFYGIILILSPRRHTSVRSSPWRRGSKGANGQNKPKKLDNTTAQQRNSAAARRSSAPPSLMPLRHKRDKKRGYFFCFPHKQKIFFDFFIFSPTNSARRRLYRCSNKTITQKLPAARMGRKEKFLSDKEDLS